MRFPLFCPRCGANASQATGTIGTLFDNTKLPFTTSFLDISLLSHSKSEVPAMDLGSQFGVSYSTVWLLRHKLMRTMRERDNGQPLRSIAEIDDAYLGREGSGDKRGCGGERQTSFVAAVQVSADGLPDLLRLSPVAVRAGARRRD